MHVLGLFINRANITLIINTEYTVQLNFLYLFMSGMKNKIKAAGVLWFTLFIVQYLFLKKDFFKHFWNVFEFLFYKTF